MVRSLPCVRCPVSVLYGRSAQSQSTYFTRTRDRVNFDSHTRHTRRGPSVMSTAVCNPSQTSFTSIRRLTRTTHLARLRLCDAVTSNVVEGRPASRAVVAGEACEPSALQARDLVVRHCYVARQCALTVEVPVPRHVAAGRRRAAARGVHCVQVCRARALANAVACCA